MGHNYSNFARSTPMDANRAKFRISWSMRFNRIRVFLGVRANETRPASSARILCKMPDTSMHYLCAGEIIISTTRNCNDLQVTWTPVVCWYCGGIYADESTFSVGCIIFEIVAVFSFARAFQISRFCRRNSSRARRKVLVVFLFE